MAWEFRKNCVDCGVERVIVISGVDENTANAMVDHEAVHGRCKPCYVKAEAEKAALPSTEELFGEELADIGRLLA